MWDLSLVAIISYKSVISVVSCHLSYTKFQNEGTHILIEQTKKKKKSMKSKSKQWERVWRKIGRERVILKEEIWGNWIK